MTKVYLLLRNNKQSGPHSLEELLAMGLKASDLIWIEGKSFGWSYPSEIGPLKQDVIKAPESIQQVQHIISGNSSATANNEDYISSSKHTAPPKEASSKPKVYVSMPTNLGRPATETPVKKDEAEIVTEDTAGKIEQKAEELRKKIQSYVPEQDADKKKIAEPLVTKYASTINEREEAYTSWIYDSKVGKKNKAFGELQKNWGSIVIAALLILVVGYGITQYHGDKKEGEVAATTAVPDANKTVPDPLITDEEKPAIQPITDVASSNNGIDNKTSRTKEEVKSRAPQDIEKANKKPFGQPPHKNGVASSEANKKPAAGLPPKDVIATPAQPVIVQSTTAAPVKETASPAGNAKKKKSFNEKVDAFFSKFSHKLEQPPAKETTSQQPDNSVNSASTAGPSLPPGTTERKAAHRDDNKTVTVADKPAVAATPPAPTANTNLAEYVQVTSNKPSENWMLGVHGMKVSLHNTSNETVKTAEVELRYYTEQNEILEKKIVNFNNIPSGKTVTLPAPDHRLADHADFRLVAAK